MPSEEFSSRFPRHSIDPGSTHLSLEKRAEGFHFREAVTCRGRYLALLPRTPRGTLPITTFEIPARSYELLKNVPPFRVNPFYPSIHLTHRAPRARARARISS